MFNFIRFFSDGRVLMELSPSPPAKIVRKLKTRETAPYGVCPGLYQLSGNKVFLTLNNDIKDREKAFKKLNKGEECSLRKTTYNMVCCLSFSINNYCYVLIHSIKLFFFLGFGNFEV